MTSCFPQHCVRFNPEIWRDSTRGAPWRCTREYGRLGGADGFPSRTTSGVCATPSPSSPPRNIDDIGAEKVPVGYSRRARVLGHQRGLVPADLLHLVRTHRRLLGAAEPPVVGQEEHLLAGGEGAHNGQHGASDKVGDEVLRRETERQASDASEAHQARRRKLRVGWIEPRERCTGQGPKER